MNATEFYEGLKQLSDFFGKTLNENQQEFYFRELKYIPIQSFNFSVKTMTIERKPTPANFPTIKEIQSFCPRSEASIQYNPDETDEQYLRRVPVIKLWEATKIYQKRGEPQAMEYMRRLHFSENDIEAVTHKATGSYPGAIPKIGKSFPKIDHTERVSELRKQAEQLTGDIPF